ncbi:MAG: ParB/RepB/Spo0J family partition protein [Acidobacteriia bacterium]|nr:ParB/RepB/Spo0J family partition protein [Terriglobia bacterium]
MSTAIAPARVHPAVLAAGAQKDTRTEDVQHIPVGLIVPSPTNQRREVDKEFIASIKRDGVTSPILVRPRQARPEDVARLDALDKNLAAFGPGDNVFEIVFGERRWEGCVRAGRDVVRALVKDLPDEKALELQIIENGHRQNLTALQECSNYAKMIELGKTPKQIAEILSKALRTVYQVLTLKKATKDVMKALSDGEIEASHAYEICGKPEEEQNQLLTWLRLEAQHSHGEVPSIRRLKREIQQRELQADEKRRQAKLFKEEGEKQDHGQTASSMPAARAAARPKPPTKAQLQTQAKIEEQMAKHKRERERSARIDKKYQALFFAALASKAAINTRFLSRIVPALILEVWEERPIEAFAQNVLKWPAPEKGEYTHTEVYRYSKKHTRKFSTSLLGAMIITQFNNKADAESLARYFGVDTKKLRWKATAEVVEEERKAKLPRTPATREERQLHVAINGKDGTWNKLRRNGATNAEIKDALGRLVPEGGTGSKDLGHVDYKGGRDPWVKLNSFTSHSQKFQGAQLIAAVRALLNIPEKINA